MELVVTGLEPLRRRPEFVELHIGGELVCAIACEVVAVHGVRVGDALTADQLARVRAADAAWRAKQAALSLLAARARARGELADRLKRKGFDEGAVESALEQVEAMGLVDDAAFSESWVRDRLKLRPRGAAALVAELRRKHVSIEIARDAVARVMAAEDVSDDALCSAAAERWAGRHAVTGIALADRQAMERKLSAYLARRGYRGDAIRAAVDATLRGRRA
jgi:regulatory protein